MKQVKLNLSKNLEKISNIATKILISGGVVIYPTDTLYGFGVNAFDEGAIKKIHKIKQQNKDKPISIIVKDIKMVRKIACVDSKVEKILEKIWPGPITIVLRKKDVIPYILTGGGETIAIRVVNNKFISALMRKVDFPITATSVNISGEKDLLKADEIIKKFNKNKIKPDLFINAGEIKNPIASTIIDLTTPEPKILRIGIVGKEKIKEFFEKFNVKNNVKN